MNTEFAIGVKLVTGILELSWGRAGVGCASDALLVSSLWLDLGVLLSAVGFRCAG